MSGARSEPRREIERIRFNGTDSEDVTDFVQAVKRIAMDQGRQRDQEWMFDYAESCLGGQAVRWFDERQSQGEALASWGDLRHALLDRFKPFSDKFIPQAAPPANFQRSIANPAPPPPRASEGNAPPIGRARRGRIKVLDLDGTLLGYCRSEQEDEGLPAVVCDTLSASDAATFEFESPTPGIQPGRLKLVGSGRVPIFIGIIQQGSNWLPFLFAEGRKL
ncbi:hypothetical protein FRB94_005592 [Tulasnella sp. JGI-2019a]|nr:hypothetical protein FRB93_003910 [Tulasnella sp. JGI-2019a]KAG9000277.1 hypothetical protein FRB94_005592 [Tulasnella sp. JGI-2019a]